jgi:hypothetical protein
MLTKSSIRRTAQMHGVPVSIAKTASPGNARMFYRFG